jgi:protein-S-isoprenylcysteine O-methyltransferase Ste14
VSSRAQKPPLQALLGTVLFVPTVPGTVVGVMPWWLSSGWRLEPPFFGVVGTRWVGVGMMLAALPLFVKFLGRFVFEGHGTPAPVAPTKHLVVGGPFRWVRNPGYVAVVSMIVGQGLVLGSAAVLVYALAVAAAFQGFVVLYEEPTLRRTFGAEYDDYCRRVPRWIPRHPRVR